MLQEDLSFIYSMYWTTGIKVYVKYWKSAVIFYDVVYQSICLGTTLQLLYKFNVNYKRDSYINWIYETTELCVGTSTLLKEYTYFYDVVDQIVCLGTTLVQLCVPSKLQDKLNVPV